MLVACSTVTMSCLRSIEGVACWSPLDALDGESDSKRRKDESEGCAAVR